MSGQRDTFLASEGDAWFARNEVALTACDWSVDPVCTRIAGLQLTHSPARILEVGCSDGSRLRYVADRFGHQVVGVDPSERAVTKARERGVNAVRATADELPFESAAFDVVVFGFCLYLCDDADLFRIAMEADRVLANPGWLLILDFEARAPLYKPYHHRAGVVSRKMDYKSMFLWHPAYTLASHEKFHHVTHQWTDEADEWVSLASLRKFSTRP